LDPVIATVQHRADLDEISVQDVIDGERKPTNGGPPQGSVDDPTHTRHSGDQSERVVKFSNELRTESRPSVLIPRKSVRDIHGGFGSKFYPIRHDC